MAAMASMMQQMMAQMGQMTQGMGGGGGGGGKGGDRGGEPPVKKRKGQAPCWYHVRGMCGWGNECTFGHDRVLCQTAAQEDPDVTTWKTELCPHLEKKKGCKFGAACHYAHGIHELLQPGARLAALQNPETLAAPPAPVPGQGGTGP